MKKVNFYQGGPKVSAVGYGAMSFSDFYGETSRENSFAILDRCQDVDMDHVDTAHMYGRGESETVIGLYLKENPSAKDFFKIATKGGIWEGKREDNEGSASNNSPEYMRKNLEESLQRLGLDCIDLYYVHRLDNRFSIDATTELMVDFIKEGKIKSYGYSEISPASLRRVNAIHPCGAIQNEYSLWCRSPELGMIQACDELNVTFVPFSPVGRGILTDKPRRTEDNSDAPFLKVNPRFIEPNLSVNLEWTDKFRAFAADKGVPTASLAVAWSIAKGRNMLTIPGTRFVKHLDELALGGSLNLSLSEVQEIETVLPAGFAQGDRYSDGQWTTQERFC